MFYRAIFILLCLSVVSQQSWGAAVDPTVIEQILGSSGPHAPTASDADKDKRVLDALANSETRSLDLSNGMWNAANPKWKPVFDHIRADLETEMPAIKAARNDAAAQHAYEAAIASQVSQSDVDAILAYYKLPVGQRYQDFMKRIDRIMKSGAKTAISHDTSPAASNILTPEQQKRCERMLMLSYLFQSMAATMPGDGAMAVEIVAKAALDKNQTELAELDKEYAADLPAFEAFAKTNASQHLYKAMGMASQTMIRSMSPLGEVIKAVEQKHQSEWRAFYQAQTGN